MEKHADLRIFHFCLVDLPFTPLSVRSLACKSPPCPCDPETIFWFNMFQPLLRSLDATAVNLARSLGTWILLEGFWIAPSETCGGFIFLQTHICDCMSIGGVTTFGVGDALRLQCAGGAFCLIGLPLTVHGGWEEALGKIGVIRGAGAAFNFCWRN